MKPQEKARQLRPMIERAAVSLPDKDGAVYESTIDNNVYSPEAYPAGWRVV